MNKSAPARRSPYSTDPSSFVGSFVLVDGERRSSQVEAFLLDLDGIEQSAGSRPVERPSDGPDPIGAGQFERVPEAARRSESRARTRQRPR